MTEEKKEEKKIIIDEDWKNKAQKEKEISKDKVPQEPAGKQGAPQHLPKGDFGTLVSLLATQAFFALGLIGDENDKTPKKDLPLAKFQIDMLESLEEKTKGNLTENEKQFLQGALSQLRISFVNSAG
ncbi:MAG: DUF1844 domain-containing protein [Sedimentisphaerales bacterium]|jgi:hypothetical protein